MTCRPRPWDGQRVAPVVPAAGTVGRGDGAERRVGGHWSSRPPGRQGVFLGRDRPAVWSWATSTPSGMNPRGLDATPWGCAAGALPRPPGPRTPRPAPPPRPAGGALRPVALGPGVPREGRRPDRRHLENWWTDPRLGRVEVVRGAGNLGRGAGPTSVVTSGGGEVVLPAGDRRGGAPGHGAVSSSSSRGGSRPRGRGRRTRGPWGNSSGGTRREGSALLQHLRVHRGAGLHNRLATMRLSLERDPGCRLRV